MIQRQVIDVVDTLPLYANGAYTTRPLSGIRFLVVHHSGVDVDSTPRQIADYHTYKLGWPGIGYHFVIRFDGTIYQTNRIETMSYNVASRNHECIGICVNGDFTSHHPFDAQLDSLRWLLKDLDTKLPNRETVGHKEIALPGHGTGCPGNTWGEWRLEVIP